MFGLPAVVFPVARTPAGLPVGVQLIGRPWAEPGLVTASLDHSMWFHRRGSVDDWLLYVQDAVAADSGRGLGAGRFFTRDGRHLATVAQEGMIRTS